MKSAAVLLAAMALSICAGAAVAGVSIPTVGSVPVETSTLPVPVPTPTVPTPPPAPVPAPSLPPAPTLPPAPSLPPVPSPPPVSSPSVLAPTRSVQVPAAPSTPQVGGTSSGIPGVSAGALEKTASKVAGTSGAPSGAPATGSLGLSGSTGGSQSAGTGPSGTQQSSQSAIGRFHASRPWLSAHGPKKNRVTMLTFRLKHRARILFTVVQVSPVCRTAGSFSVVGHHGVNRVRFNGKLHGHLLRPGTYRIEARTRDRQAVLHVVVVVVASGAPSATELAAALHSDACALRAARESISARSYTSAGVLAANATRSDDSQLANSDTEGAAQTFPGPDSRPSAMGPPVVVSSKLTNPAALVLMGLAVLLLGVAALPTTAVSDPRLNEALAHHRTELALAGAFVLAAGTVALLLS